MYGVYGTAYGLYIGYACEDGSVSAGMGMTAWSVVASVVAWEGMVVWAGVSVSVGIGGAVASISTVVPAVGEVGGTGGAYSSEETFRREVARMPSMCLRSCCGVRGLVADGGFVGCVGGVVVGVGDDSRIGDDGGGVAGGVDAAGEEAGGEDSGGEDGDGGDAGGGVSGMGAGWRVATTLFSWAVAWL